MRPVDRPSYSTNSASCNPAAAIERLGGDLELYRELVRRFLIDSAGNRQKVQDAVATADPAALHSAAHSLKGLAASCGAEGVVQALTELETLGREANTSDMNRVWQHFQDQMQVANEQLGKYCGDGEIMPKRAGGKPQTNSTIVDGR